MDGSGDVLELYRPVGFAQGVADVGVYLLKLHSQGPGHTAHGPAGVGTLGPAVVLPHDAPSSGYPLATVGTELTAIAAVVIGGTLLTGGAGFVFGTLIGVLTMGLIQTYIVFDGTLSSWWTKIIIGLLLLAFILLQKGLLRVTTARAGA